MKNFIKILIFSLLAQTSYAQHASEIDAKFVKLPRYANEAAITSAIATPTQGMLVYNIGTASNWYHNGTAWTNTAGSLALPFSQNFNGTSDIFYIGNIGTLGSVAAFETGIATNPDPVIRGNNWGTGPTISAQNSGTGSSGIFYISNTSNSSAAISAQTNGNGNSVDAINGGKGKAGFFSIPVSSNGQTSLESETFGAGVALKATSYGNGNAGLFTISNNASASEALNATTDGTGKAGSFSIINSSNSNNAVYARTNGTGITLKSENIGTAGGAGHFNIVNTTNSNAALWAQTNGTGFGGLFGIDNATSSANTIHSTTNGVGSAGYFQTTKVSNSTPALRSYSNNPGSAILGQNTGIGNAASFIISNTSSNSEVVNVQTNGIGRGMVVLNKSLVSSAIRAVNLTDLGTALEIEGGIKVTGTNKAAFKTITNATYILGNSFGIVNTTLANDATDMLIISYEYTGGSYLNKQFASYWNGGNWEIHLTDGTAMPVGITFNVLVIKQ